MDGKKLEDNPFVQLFPNVENLEDYVSSLQKLTSFLVNHDDAIQELVDKTLKEKASSRETVSDPVSVSPVTSQPDQPPEIDETKKINCLIEEIFLFTLSKKPLSFQYGFASSLLYLKELAISLDPVELLNMENLEQALFERLLVEDPSAFILTDDTKKYGPIPYYISEKECITYLFSCYLKVLEKKMNSDYSNSAEIFENMIKLIVRNVATALKQPELYEANSQELPKQVSFI